MEGYIGECDGTDCGRDGCNGWDWDRGEVESASKAFLFRRWGVSGQGSN